MGFVDIYLPFHADPAPKFFVTTAKCDFLDGKHVVFGKVIDGMLTLRKIENVPTGPNNRPKLAVKIVGEDIPFPYCYILLIFYLFEHDLFRMWRDVNLL